MVKPNLLHVASLCLLMLWLAPQHSSADSQAPEGTQHDDGDFVTDYHKFQHEQKAKSKQARALQQEMMLVELLGGNDRLVEKINRLFERAAHNKTLTKMSVRLLRAAKVTRVRVGQNNSMTLDEAYKTRQNLLGHVTMMVLNLLVQNVALLPGAQVACPDCAQANSPASLASRFGLDSCTCCPVCRACMHLSCPNMCPACKSRAGQSRAASLSSSTGGETNSVEDKKMDKKKKKLRRKLARKQRVMLNSVLASYEPSQRKLVLEHTKSMSIISGAIQLLAEYDKLAQIKASDKRIKFAQDVCVTLLGLENRRNSDTLGTIIDSGSYLSTVFAQLMERAKQKRAGCKICPVEPQRASSCKNKCRDVKCAKCECQYPDHCKLANSSTTCPPCTDK